MISMHIMRSEMGESLLVFEGLVIWFLAFDLFGVEDLEDDDTFGLLFNEDSDSFVGKCSDSVFWCVAHFLKLFAQVLYFEANILFRKRSARGNI